MSCLQLVKFPIQNCRFLNQGRQSIVNVVTKRAVSSTEECNEDKKPKCTTEGISQMPCEIYKRKRSRRVDGGPQPNFKFRSMWEAPRCCVTCPEVFKPFRHDLVYLETTDYRERKYQRTWPQCSRRCLKPKKCYCEPLNIPEMEKRERGQKNPDANFCLNFHECMKVEKYEKPCKENMCRPKKRCIFSAPSCCQKRCTQYPSYSECCARALVKKRPTECNCLYPNGLCAVNEYLKRMGLLKPDE